MDICQTHQWLFPGVICSSMDSRLIVMYIIADCTLQQSTRPGLCFPMRRCCLSFTNHTVQFDCANFLWCCLFTANNNWRSRPFAWAPGCDCCKDYTTRYVLFCYVTHISELDICQQHWSVMFFYKKAVLSQRWPRDVHFISGSNEPLQNMAIRNYPRWRTAANLDLM